MVIEIEFAKLESWTYPNIKSYQYDFILDSDIDQAIEILGNKAPIISNDGWPGLTENHSTKEDNPFHIEHVANLVNFIKLGNDLDPITIIAEEDIRNQSGFCISDGHHRVRAYKYLRVESINAIVRGDYGNYSFLLID
jgi:hypothetical protein